MSDIKHSIGRGMARAPVRSNHPSFAEAIWVWLRIGLLSFGGPTAQIALMHREVVDRKGWLGEQSFLNALSFCMLLPGPEAMQLATYAGWRLHGLAGGLAAGLLFVLPGAVLVLALAMIYATFGDVALVQAIFIGVKAAVLVIVIEALLRVAKKALNRRIDWVIAAGSFSAIFLFSLPFPLVILLAAITGFLAANGAISTTDPPGADSPADATEMSFGGVIRTAAIWLLIWLLPLVAIALVFGRGHVLTELSIFFSKLAIVTFGGAYAVLAYMTQEVVQNHGWLSAGEMLDGLGLAETTNGPLILVTEFVGYLAAYRFGEGPPIFMGLLGAAVTLWATFAPCFLWVFTGAPFIERLQRLPRLSGALQGVTAAVVGVILNLTVWFGLHVFFAKVDPVAAGPLTLWMPDLATIDWLPVVLAIIAALGLLRFHLGLAWVLAITGGLSLAWHLII
ncbi:MAG: chromate efflux transporter [Pseudomonadota bacterium]